MNFQGHIFSPAIRRTAGCFSVIWLFAVVTNIDRLHNHHTLDQSNPYDTGLCDISHAAGDLPDSALLESSVGGESNPAKCADGIVLCDPENGTGVSRTIQDQTGSQSEDIRVH